MIVGRINRGKFRLDDNEYDLAVNNGVNHLHGGLEGFDKKIWSGSEVSRVAIEGVSAAKGICFKRLSPAGEEGYPGNLYVWC